MYMKIDREGETDWDGNRDGEIEKSRNLLNLLKSTCRYRAWPLVSLPAAPSVPFHWTFALRAPPKKGAVPELLGALNGVTNRPQGFWCPVARRAECVAAIFTNAIPAVGCDLDRQESTGFAFEIF